MLKFGLSINDTYKTTLTPDSITYILFDFIESCSISEESQVSSFPLINKSLISDHKYNKPRKINLNGTISNLNWKEYYYFDKKKIGFFKKIKDKLDRKTNLFYELIRSLKNNNILLNFHTPTTTIKKIIITSFSFTEQNEYATYSLSLEEIFTFEFEEVKTKQLEPDNSLPELNDPIPQSAVETLLLADSTETDLLVYNTLKDEDLITDEFVTQLLNFKLVDNNPRLNTALSVIATVAAGAAIGGVGAAIIVTALSTVAIALTNPVGWIALAVGAIIGAIVACVMWLVNLFKWIERRRIYMDEFTSYNELSMMEKEKKRYDGLMGNIYNSLKNLDTKIQSYAIGSDYSQELLITVNNTYYTLKFFTKNQSKKQWYWSLQDVNGNYLNGYEKNVLKCYTSLYNLTNDNYEYWENNEKIYFVYDLKTLAQQYQNQSNIKLPEIIFEGIDLSKVKLIITDFQMDNLKKVIAEITLENMKRK